MEKRIPLQVQVLVYRRKPQQKFLILGLRRVKERGDFWQPVTGGVKKGEDLEKAALREVREETGIAQPIRCHRINFMHTFPVEKPYKKFYDKGVSVVKEYAFGLETDIEEIRIDPLEHTDYRWMDPQEMMKYFKFKGNKKAVKALTKQLKNETSNNSY